jgi:hypothetical protein
MCAVRALSWLAADLPRRTDGKVNWPSSLRLAYQVINDPGKVGLWLIGILMFVAPFSSIYWIVVLDDLGERLKSGAILVVSSLIALATMLLLVERIGERHRAEMDELARAQRERDRHSSEDA